VKYSVQLPTDRVDQGDEFVHVDSIVELSEAIEHAGFDACYVTEHPIPSDDWLASGGHHALDPFVALSAAAVVTRRLALHTNLIVLPYRNPFLTAKSVASLDAISSGRVIMGVGTGYLKGEYAALGADFEGRNAATDHALEAMKAAWRGESVKCSGVARELPGNTALPRPSQRPHPRIWIGGNSKMAMRRAAEHGQGWSPFPLPADYAGRARTAAIETIDDLRKKLGYLNEFARSIGRDDPLDINFVPFGHGMNAQHEFDFPRFRDEVAALEEIGVTWLSVGLPGKSCDAYLESIARFGDEMIG
jgi:probable F420-dependent oxidoreductase